MVPLGNSQLGLGPPRAVVAAPRASGSAPGTSLISSVEAPHVR